MKPALPLALSLAIASTAMAGWFDGAPSESQAEAYWRNQLSNSNGLLQMTSFKKTDGKSDTTPGGNIYVLYYTFTFEARDDCQYSENFQATRGLPQGGLDSLHAFAFQQSVVHKGTRLIQTGEMDYEKRESGWVLINVNNRRIFENPADVQKHAEEAARKKAEQDRIASEKQARLAVLTAKAKERHTTIRQQPVWNDSWPRKQTWQVILSDVDITLIFRAGTWVFWFGDIQQVNPVTSDDRNELVISRGNGTNEMALVFGDRAELTEFYAAFQATWNKWHDANLELLELSTGKPAVRLSSGSQEESGVQSPSQPAEPAAAATANSTTGNRDALIAKAKERHKTVWEDSLLNGKIVVSDCDLIVSDNTGKSRTIWFPDIVNMRAENNGVMNVSLRDGETSSFKFRDSQSMLAFAQAFRQSVSDWRKANPELMVSRENGAQ